MACAGVKKICAWLWPLRPVAGKMHAAGHQQPGAQGMTALATPVFSRESMSILANPPGCHVRESGDGRRKLNSTSDFVKNV
jgi:hypothetical protein